MIPTRRFEDRMGLSPEARELLATTVMARLRLWADRNWWWMAPTLLFALYVVTCTVDRLDEARGRYAQIEHDQAAILQALNRASYCDPAFYIIEADSARAASDKLLKLNMHIDAHRISLLADGSPR